MCDFLPTCGVRQKTPWIKKNLLFFLKLNMRHVTVSSMSFIHRSLLLEMPVPVASSPNQGSVAVCVLLASEWR